MFIRSLLVSVLSATLITATSAVVGNLAFAPTIKEPAVEAASNLPHSVLRLPNVHPGRDPIYAYAKQVLTMALDATADEYGTFELIVSEQEVAQERQLRSLEHSMLDVTWSVTSIEREKQHKAIRIPLMGGLFGMRTLFIRANDTRFNEPLSLAALKTMRAVQGYDWPDTRIFRHNNIPVLETTYRASFRIVAEGFADMFPRSVLEIQNEWDNLSPGDNLAIEPHLVIHYDSPMFFFVSSDREDLATRIAKGLLILLETGELQQSLYALEVYKQSLALLENRQRIELENPLLSEQSRQALATYLPYFTGTPKP